MNAIRLAVGVLFLVMGSKACTLVSAQDVAQSPETRVMVSDAEGENAHLVRPDDGLQRAGYETDSVGNAAVSMPEQQPTLTRPVVKWEDDGLVEYCHPSCNAPCPSVYGQGGQHVGQCGGRDACNAACPSVYGQVEAMFMRREPRFTQQPIVVNDATNTTLLSTSDLNFNFEPGVRATVGMRLCEGRALEFSYFGLWQGVASGAAVSPNPAAFLIFPDNLVGNVFVDMDRTDVNYSSRVHSFELNLPCCRGCCSGSCCSEVRCRSFEWFSGLRYLNLGEEFNIAAQRTVAGQIEEGSYDIRTANHLYGAQLGARLRRSRGSFGWEATGKAGIFGNDSQQRQSVTDFPDFQLRETVSSRGGTVAFVGEINLSAFCRLTDVWNLRAGYNAIWIEGLALAPNQLDFNFAQSPSGNQLHNGGGMFLHGANVGLEARW